jgi:hypothetical protein
MKAPWAITLLVALGILATFAFANEGRQPPRAGCTFEAGQTTCVTFTEELVWYSTSTRHICVIGFWYDQHVYGVYRTYTTTTYYGNSFVVESVVVSEPERVRFTAGRVRTSERC